MATWNSLTKKQQSYARTITHWAWTQGALEVTVSQVAKDLDTWAAAYRTRTLPAAVAEAAAGGQDGAGVA